MNQITLSDSELLILGLVAEMPRHGYELEQVIEQRAMREWTRIGFSSIYYVLGKLKKNGLISAETPENPRSRKRYRLSDQGQEVLIQQTLETLETVQPAYPSLLMGLIHLSNLTQDQAVRAFQKRRTNLEAELERVKRIQFEQQPLPDYVDAIFEYSIKQLDTELDWLDHTLAYLENKTWIY